MGNGTSKKASKTKSSNPTTARQGNHDEKENISSTFSRESKRSSRQSKVFRLLKAEAASSKKHDQSAGVKFRGIFAKKKKTPKSYSVQVSTSAEMSRNGSVKASFKPPTMEWSQTRHPAMPSTQTELKSNPGYEENPKQRKQDGGESVKTDKKQDGNQLAVKAIASPEPENGRSPEHDHLQEASPTLRKKEPEVRKESSDKPADGEMEVSRISEETKEQLQDSRKIVIRGHGEVTAVGHENVEPPEPAKTEDDGKDLLTNVEQRTDQSWSDSKCQDDVTEAPVTEQVTDLIRGSQKRMNGSAGSGACCDDGATRDDVTSGTDDRFRDVGSDEMELDSKEESQSGVVDTRFAEDFLRHWGENNSAGNFKMVFSILSLIAIILAVVLAFRIGNYSGSVEDVPTGIVGLIISNASSAE